MSAILCALAASLGPDRTEREILGEILSTQCTHRFKERRVQAALLCRTLSSQCRLHTVIESVVPVLIRMSHHETEIAVEVREEALESLGFVLRSMLRNQSTVSCSKSLLKSLRDVLVATFEDFEPSVSDAAYKHILRPIVQLEDSEGCLYDNKNGLLSAVVSSLSKYTDRVFEKTTIATMKITRLSSSPPPPSSSSSISPLLSLQRVLRAVSSLMSPLRESIVRGRFSPQAARAALKLNNKKKKDDDDDDDIEVLNAVLSGATAVAQMEDGLQWPALKYMCTQFVPNILQQLSRARLDTRDGKQIKSLVLSAVERLCQTFGELFTEVIMRPLFLVSMNYEMRDMKPPVRKASSSFLRIMGRDIVDDEAWWLDCCSHDTSLSRTQLFERLGPIYTQSVSPFLSSCPLTLSHTHTYSIYIYRYSHP